MICVTWLLPRNGREREHIWSKSHQTPTSLRGWELRDPSFTWLGANHVHSEWIARRSGCVFSHLFGCFLLVGSYFKSSSWFRSVFGIAVLLWWSFLFLTTLRFLHCIASLQSQDKTPSEEGNTRWPQGHPPSVLSNGEGRKSSFT